MSYCHTVLIVDNGHKWETLLHTHGRHMEDNLFGTTPPPFFFIKKECLLISDVQLIRSDATKCVLRVEDNNTHQ